MKNRALKDLKILLVEDEDNLARLLKAAIGDNFHTFSVAKDGLEGIAMFVKLKPDIVITDIMMPHLSGLDMARELKKIDSDVFIIMISAFSEKDKLLGAIDVGVAKYFIKPFDPDELLEYIDSISHKFCSKTVELNDGFVFNKVSNSLYKNDRFVSLTKNEIRFLNLLLENPDKPVDDYRIKVEIWREEASDERLRTFIRRVRAKTSKKLISNIKGVGYQLTFNDS